jgi:alpha-beta hydrolase superfamily lysophospholipase
VLMVSPIRRGLLAAATLSLIATALFTSSAVAKSSYKEPALTAPKARLAESLVCPTAIKRGGLQPMMLVTGTGYTGEEAYAIGSAALKTTGRPICYVNFPYRTTGDIQIAAEYLVSGIRRMAARYGKRIAVFGISQGGLLPRWALTYWPSLRAKVSDVIAVAGTQHGTTVGLGACSALNPCQAASWQQGARSKMLKALNAEPDESPGSTSWTTVRTATDETVQPTTGKNPTSSLKGATNILIQAVCPGRKVSHIGSALDSVTFAASEDALTHKGPAKVKRLPKNVCSKLLAPGLNASAAGSRLIQLTPFYTEPAMKLPAEPRVRAYAHKRVP